ncbi:MAG: RyR domain-containing protein [Candidatus Omnitrophica bacterium]|nr:RyR domain-containing protein [Candidatus Omnitrophota bacterium]
MKRNIKQSAFSWEREQIERYIIISPLYKQYAEVIKSILDKVAQRYTPLAIVQARPKSISSFAEKIQRKRSLYKNAVKDMTDLCGARIIVHTQDEVRVLCDFIENNFEIDWENSIDVTQRLKPLEFGYRSVHYIVKFKRGVFPGKNIDVEIPKTLFGLKAEVQIRTILEHAWADFTHDRTYKSSCCIPQAWLREFAAIAAVLESADKEFCRMESRLKAYTANYGRYMSPEEIQEEIRKLELVLQYDRHNVELVSRIGKLAITAGDWKKAVNVLSPYVSSKYQPILRDLGISLCKLHKNKPKSRQYREGQAYLEAASASPNRDVDAVASLAGTWRGIDEEKVRNLYRQSFEIDPTDPYALQNYLDYEISYRRDASIVASVRPLIETAVQKCRKQIEMDINLPWAFYNIGNFYLLLGKPYESLSHYAKAIQLSSYNWMLERSLSSLDKIAPVEKEIPGYAWVRKLLLLGNTLKFKNDLSHEFKPERRDTAGVYQPITGPVIILAGSCEKNSHKQIGLYRRIFLEAFRGFRGTIISGGTTVGISGIAGELQKKYPHAIHTIGYVPRKIPSDVTVDRRYSEIRMTAGDDFTPLEALQMWVDLTSSGINPGEIKLIGINGGINSAAEYRLALAFGAYVAIIKESGQEAGKLLSDPDWSNAKRLMPLFADALTLEAFVCGKNEHFFTPVAREKVAQAFHENHRRDKSQEIYKKEPAMLDWDRLPDNLKESNRQLSDSIGEKLDKIGYAVKKGSEKVPVNFTSAEIEILGEMEHARWVIERLLDGWKLGEVKDTSNKISPYLVPWSELPDSIKEWDRIAVHKIPQFLAESGLTLVRKRRK